MHKANASSPIEIGQRLAHLLDVPVVYSIGLVLICVVCRLFYYLGIGVISTHNYVQSGTRAYIGMEMNHSYLLSDAEAGIARYRAKASSASRVI